HFQVHLLTFAYICSEFELHLHTFAVTFSSTFANICIHFVVSLNYICRQQRTVHVLHNSEQPASVFSILESGNKTIPLVADGLFDLLMMKMTTVYTSKKQTKIEAKGPRFEIGDFCVKLGSVTMTQNFKGVLVE
ncbi:hypothetical protein L9F63_021626, partial [Diploptera punctata]